MEWPHDPDGDDGSEGMRKYGMAILAKKLDEEADFPLSFEEFSAAVGDHPIRINARTVVAAHEILAHVEESDVEDMTAFHRAIGRAMRSGDFWEYHPVGPNPERKRA